MPWGLSFWGHCVFDGQSALSCWLLADDSMADRATYQ